MEQKQGDQPERSPGRSGRRTGAFRLCKVSGIEVRLDFTLIVVFFLVAASLGNGTLPAWHPEWSRTLVWTVAVGAAALFFASVLAHEFSHALVARARGMHVAGITLFMFGGVTELDGEPPRPRAEFLMAIVGPLTSLAIGVIATLGGSAFVKASADAVTENPGQYLPAVGPIGTLLLWLGPVNVLLGLFNLIPGFPLDGGRVLRALLWSISGNFEKATIRAAAVGEIFAWAIIALGIFIAFGGRVPYLGRGLFQGLWLVLIGWFLTSAARVSVARVTEASALRGVPVRSLVADHIDVLDQDDRLESAVRETLLRSNQNCFPVLADGQFAGLVAVRDIQAAHDQWSTLHVKDVMTPAERVSTVPADADAADAVRELANRDVNEVAVMERNRRFVGLLRREDVVRWLAFHPIQAT